MLCRHACFRFEFCVTSPVPFDCNLARPSTTRQAGKFCQCMAASISLTGSLLCVMDPAVDSGLPAAAYREGDRGGIIILWRWAGMKNAECGDGHSIDARISSQGPLGREGLIVHGVSRR